MPVRQGGRTVRDPKTGKEKREGGTRQDRAEGEIPKGHPAERAEPAKAAGPATEESPKVEGGKAPPPKGRD